MNLKGKITAAALAAVMTFTVSTPLAAESSSTNDFGVPSCILMEASTGLVLYEYNADEQLPPASVTKIMTLLLVMEAVDDGRLGWEEKVQTSEYAASMGGSQVFLEPGEEMPVWEMVKCVVVASANDAAVALAEKIAGSEEAFVTKMNERAAELGMVNTVFKNTNGLDDTVEGHVTSARDIAIMSRELITKHPKILEFSSIWMDTIRDGAFGLTNTNRLIRFYRGANGLKTGSTSKAKFCISASALRDDMQLIAVIMAVPTRDERNEAAKKLLDYGFANWEVASREPEPLEPLRVLGGVAETVPLEYTSTQAVVKKGAGAKVTTQITLPENISAPVEAGTEVGRVEYVLDGEVIGSVPITAGESVDRVSYGGILLRLIRKLLLVDA
ncbi:MAG: D-alanyl-D-alanine carboxypeptidase [Clostridiales bacterium]|nr:D-alanyl-D-alanine carboxypeptidase [Clostridiales bacterium]